MEFDNAFEVPLPPAEAWPLYVRDKVAQTTEERAALKKATLMASAT